MKIIYLIILVSVLTGFYSVAQDESGYWAEERAIKLEISLSSQSKTWKKVNIPVGTTQLIYRVTFYSPNDKIRNSLAGAVSGVSSISSALGLLDAIGGPNKGTFYVFKTYEDVNNHHNNNITKKVCYKSSADIPEEKGYFKLEESGCLTSNTDYLYFAFYNGNASDPMKIILEILPWIDNVASRGWTKSIKEDFLRRCIEDEKDLTQPEEVCQCLLDKLQENYKRSDFDQMTESEINKLIAGFRKECISETGEDENLFDIERDYADSLAENGQYGEAINKLLPIVESGKASTADFNDIGYYYIMTKQYLKAIKHLKDGEKLDETELLIKGNLAHAYLLNGDLDLAKAIYLKHKTQNIDDKTSWVDMVKIDFEIFKKSGLSSDNFEIVLSLLK